MSNSLFAGTSLPTLEQLASFSQRRHHVLASNIANLDTPGYRTRDLDAPGFQERLKRALAERDQQHTSLANVVPDRKTNTFDQVRKEMNSIVYHDDTNVGLEQQVAELTKNQLQHNLAIAVMSNQFRLLEAAVSERA